MLPDKIAGSRCVPRWLADRRQPLVETRKPPQRQGRRHASGRAAAGA
jgi:hypothetical protein